MDKVSVLYMLFSVLTWSLFPLLSARGIDQLAVFDYIMLTYIVGAVASYLMLVLMPGYRKNGGMRLRLLTPRLIGEIFIGTLTVLLSFACLLTSFSYISKAGATIIYEIWPIVAMFITPLLIKKGWTGISARDGVFSLLAFIGVGFLMYPEVQNTGISFFSAPGQYYHVFLPLLGGVFMAIASVMKSRVSFLLQDDAHPVASLLRVQVMFCIGVILLAIPFVFLWPDKTSVYTTENIIAVLVIGTFIHTLGNVAYTMAVLRTSKSNIVVLWYLMPIFSVVWLWLAGESQITPYIILGAVFIITANLIMSIKADESMAYTAAILALLVCGVYAYFIDGLAMDDYYQALSVPVVFYTILVAFMMDRLIRRDRLEEERGIAIMNHIEGVAQQLTAPAAGYTACINGIVTTTSAAEIDSLYRKLRNAKEPALRPIYNQLDELAISKVQGTGFAEFFVLLLLAALTVVTALVFRPNNIIGDGFGVVTSLTVIFVLFMVLDLQRQRRTFYLTHGTNGERGIARQLTASLTAERILSAALIVLIMAAFLALLLLHRYPAAG